MKPLVYKKNPVKGCCPVIKCSRKVKGGGLCNTHRKTKSRLADPERYAYQNIKNRAKQRNKPFTITLEYFRKFCHSTTYIAGKGRNIGSFNVDCKINELGYVEGNLQVLEKLVNIKKYYEYDWQSKTGKVVTAGPVKTDEVLPF